jgi:tripartite-type tricarboxylate transporter receptor subunit TctC
MTVNKRTITTSTVGVILFAVFFLLWQPCSEAATAADFYKDKKITFIASSKAGGGTDLIARILAPYLKKYTGAYAVVVDNVSEAGGMLALNRLWNSKPDGLTLCINIPHSTVLMEVGKEEGVQYQCEKFNVIFAATSTLGQVLIVNAKGPFHSIDDIKKAKGLKSACVYGVANVAAFFADVLGLDAKVTPGMSTGDSRMALLRGEIDYAPENLIGTLEGIESGALRPLCVNISTFIPALPQAPSITQFASLSPQQKEWIKIFDLTDVGKYVFAGPNIPKERTEYLRTVFERIHNDQQFLQDRKKIERYPGSLPWLNGAEANRIFTNYLNLTKGKGHNQMTEYLSNKYFTTKEFPAR